MPGVSDTITHTNTKRVNVLERVMCMFLIDSKRFRELLSQSGLSLREFAAKSGLNAATVCKLVRDGERATLKVVGKIARFFNVDTDELILKA